MIDEVTGHEAAAGSPRISSPSWIRTLRSPALLALTLGCLAFYLWHGIGEQRSYRTTGFDLGIFDQAVRAYAHFRAPMVALKGPGYDVLGDHFHPIIALLAPLYWIWDSPQMLIIAQAVLISASIPVVYRFALRRTDPWLALLVSAAYGLGWPVMALIDFDFHEVAFATPLLAFAIDALDRRDDRSLLIWSLLLFGVREDMGIVVVLLGLLRIVQGIRPSRAASAADVKTEQAPAETQQRGWWQRRWPGVVLVATGFAAYFISTSVIIPHFASGHSFAYGSQYDALGNSVGEALGNILKHPLTAAKLLVSPQTKLTTILYLLVPFALIPLRSRYSILALPLLAERFFNSRANLWQPHFHYNALPWLIFTLALLDGAARLGLFSAARWAHWGRILLAAWLVIFPVLLVVNPSSAGPTPITKTRDGVTLAITAAVRAQMATVAFLPHNTCVEAANTLVPHLTNRNYVSLANTQNWTADFIALDLSVRDVGGNPPAATPKSVYDAAIAHGYKPVFTDGSMVVLQSPDYSGSTNECKPLGAGKNHP
ncbi:Predicted membrane protein [Frankineae bacterium MT45]|nr:Predicted membrane protein [Frankineae bacterium MT45]